MPDDAASTAAPASEGQLQAMLSLLSDPNPKVSDGSREALVGQGEHARPTLERALATTEGRDERRLRSILAAIRFPHADEALLEHLLGGPELERGALLLARLVDGGPEPDEVAAALDAMAADVSARLPDGDDPDVAMSALAAVLVEDRQLSGVPPEHAVPVDALLHGVTAGRGGMPLPLCMTWMLVARRCGIPLVGVNMPGHFLMRLDVPGELRVFDAFRGGLPMSRAHCEQWLARFGMEGVELDSLACDDTELLLRSVRNLVNLASADDDGRLAERGTKILATARLRLGR
jgi:regulator of sirC expression with transglutaminase-like and TPR domain